MDRQRNPTKAKKFLADLSTMDPAIKKWFEGPPPAGKSKRQHQTELVNNAYDLDIAGEYVLNTDKPFFREAKEQYHQHVVLEYFFCQSFESCSNFSS